MASLELKRTPRINEQREIADLFATKIAAGFTAADIRDSVGGNWEGVRDRVRVLIARLKEMPDRPLRRPTARRPTVTSWECAECGDPVIGAPTASGACPRCWDESYERAQDKLAELEPAFGIALLDEARKYLEANGWRAATATQHILAAELMHAQNAPARAAQVLAKWDRRRAQADRDREGAR